MGWVFGRVSNEGMQLVRTKDRLVYRKRASGRRKGVERRWAVATPEDEMGGVAIRYSECSVPMWAGRCGMRFPRIQMRRGRSLEEVDIEVKWSREVLVSTRVGAQDELSSHVASVSCIHHLPLVRSGRRFLAAAWAR